MSLTHYPDGTPIPHILACRICGARTFFGEDHREGCTYVKPKAVKETRK